MNLSNKKLPVQCPSCAHPLRVRRFECEQCGTSVEGSFDLPVLARLAPGDQAFILHFVKCSGNLKDLAAQYGVSYPTVRNRLDDLIERVADLERNAEPPQEKCP